MCFADFISNFNAINVCKVNDWNEVRIKGEFTTASQTEGDNKSVRSRHFYELTVSEEDRDKTLIISLHQEDERIQDVMMRRPYITLGLAILQRHPETGAYNLVVIKDFVADRQIEI